jgi:hypothetical protein
LKVEISKLPDFARATKNARDAAKRELEIQLLNAIREIDARTRSGKDVDNRPFAKYTEKYRKYKVDKRKRQSTVDLTLSGDMLAAMNKVEVINEAKGIAGFIKFGSALAATKARGHMEGLGRNKIKRRFFELSKLQIKKISDSVKAAIIEAMKP